MQLTRRRLLATAAPAVAFAVAGCATTTTNGVTTYGLSPTVVATIQNVVASVVAYTPSIESIASIAASLFGPGYAAIVTAGSAAVNAIEAALQAAVNNLSPPVSSKFAAKFRASAPGLLVGYATVNGKLIPVFAGPHI
jgi:hypothetical protein